MKLLITGAGGFIGRRIVAALRGRTDLELVLTGRKPQRLTEDVGFVACDLLEPGAGAKLIDEVKPSHLLHLAWEATPGAFWRSNENIRWAAASLNLINAFQAAGGQRVVVAGTVAEYAWNERIYNEDLATCEPSTLYGVCKDAVRRVVESSLTDGPTSWAWGRIFWLYGPGEAPGRLVSDVASSLACGRVVECTSGVQVRDFLHVDDVAGSFIAALDSNWSGVFNVCSGEGVPIRSIIDILAEEGKRQDLVRFGARTDSISGPSEIIGCNARLINLIGYEPRIKLRNGLSDTFCWWRSKIVNPAEH